MPNTMQADTKSMGMASMNTSRNGNRFAVSVQTQSVNLSPKLSKLDILGMKMQMRNTVDIIHI